MRSGLLPATQAAAASTMPAADPQVTSPASAPVTSAIRLPTARLSSSISTKRVEASAIAASTSGSINDPPANVVGPRPLMIGLAPIRW